MKQLSKLQKFENRATAINIVAEYCNKVIPLLQARLNAGFKIKTTAAEFYEKDRKDITAIKQSAPVFRATIKIKDSAIWITVDHTFQVSEYGCCYYKKEFCLWDRNLDKECAFVPLRSDHSAAEMMEADQCIAGVENELEELKAKLSTLKNITGGL